MDLEGTASGRTGCGRRPDVRESGIFCRMIRWRQRDAGSDAPASVSGHGSPERDQGLASLDKLKSDFVAIASHELRTPLAIIKGYVDAFEQGELGDLDEFQLSRLGIMNRRVDEMTRIIDDLLDLTRIGRGDLIGAKRETPLRQLLSYAVEELREDADSSGLRLTCSVEPGLPAVYMDVARIYQVLRGLIDNALKFASPGGTVELSARLLPGGRDVEVQVADSGPGIPEEELDRVFTMFYQVDSTTTRTASGMGLGLVLARGIVEGHRGRIWIESGAGAGSAVKFTLPLQERPEGQSRIRLRISRR
jgi:signal transduction histidine kinase